MASDLQRLYNGGYVTARDRADIQPNELQKATGMYYKPGNQKDAHKMGGRSTFGDTTTAAKVGGIAIAQFDSGGTDYLLALSSGKLYGATPGLTGSPALLYTLTGSGATLDVAHANDRWYLAMDSENRVLESDGTLRTMGMQAPGVAPTLAEQNAGSVNAVPNADDAGFTEASKAYDSSLNTAAVAQSGSAGTTTGVWSFAAAAGAAGRKVHVLWSLHNDTPWAVGENLGAVVRVKIEKSEDSGSNYTEIINTLTNEQQAKQWSAISISDATNLSTLRVRASLTYVLGTTNIYFRIFHIKVQDTGATGTISADALLYAFTEYDAAQGNESIPSPVSTITFTNKAAVRITLPSVVNSRATHYRIYRTADNGTLHQLGRIAQVPVAQTTFDDDFTEYGVDEQPETTIQFVEFEAEGAVIRSPRDFPPPNLKRIVYVKGALAGLTSTDPRALFYSVQGHPESWPQLYVINSIPLEEHDELIDLVELGGSLILAARGAMVRIDELPRSVAGVFVSSEAVQIKGAPGCVGPYALTTVNYGGQSHAAWISPENGILVTDGHRWESIADDLDWSDFEGHDKSGWVLSYYKHLRILRMDYSSSAGGGNDRFLLFHIDKLHLKNGQAKITGPHYGKAASLVVGQVDDTTRIYTGHWSDGKIYVEMNTATGADSSLAYDASGTWPLIIQGPRRYDADWRSYSALDARLYHGDFGTGQTVTVSYVVGRDASEESSTRSQSVSLEGNLGTQFDIARSGEWHEETLTHTGTGLGHIGSLTVRARVQGDEGKQRVVA